MKQIAFISQTCLLHQWHLFDLFTTFIINSDLLYLNLFLLTAEQYNVNVCDEIEKNNFLI